MCALTRRKADADATLLAPAIILGCIVLTSRLPFLDAGYGHEPDAWRMAVAARAIATTGTYTVSRFPGYPIPEIVYSLLWSFGPVAFNALTAFFSALATISFWLYARTFVPKDAMLTSLAFAFTPIIFINSTSSKDYMWALAFVVASWCLCSNERTCLAGVVLGLGIGSRLTSVLMLAPLVLTLFASHRIPHAILNAAKLVAGTAVTAAIVFLPAWLTYGSAFLTFSDQLRYPDTLVVIQRATEGIWGRLGFFGIALAIASRLLWPHAEALETPLRKAVPRQLVCAWVLTVSLYFVAFLRLPHQSGYLIPAVPFVLLVLVHFVPRPLYRGTCVLLILSSFVTVGRHGVHEGPIFVDRQTRREDVWFVGKLIETIRGLPDGSLVVVGWYLPLIEASAADPGQAADIDRTVLARVLYLVDGPTLDALSGSGTKVYYLPQVREFNRARYGVDLKVYKATPLELESETKQSQPAR